MAALLNARGLAKSFGSEFLFENLEMVVNEGERLGLIGPNGAGKSTFLKILAGLEPPDEGEVVRRKGLKLAYVPQIERFEPGVTVSEAVAQAAREAGLHDIDAAVSIILGKVALIDPHVEAVTLSGGGQKRLTIARGLVREPDILLLDEPTNHLDVHGFLWLENLLGRTTFAWVMVSHDRRFLERTATRVAELDPIFPDQWLEVDGNYSDFLRRKTEYIESLTRYKDALANKVRRESEWLSRSPKARTTKSKSRVDGAYDLMEELARVRGNLRKRETNIEFSASGRKTRKLVEMKGIRKSMGDRPIVSELDLLLSPGTRLGLLGSNGSGKTTLLRMISGNLEPDAGTVRNAPDLKVVYFEQNRSELDPNQTLQRSLCETGDNVIYQGRPLHIISWARRFRFTPDQLPSPVSTLSGGEQARLMIARLMLRSADVLILDEPTNDLDIPTLEVLESSLDDFPGALVLVTHDRFMLDRVCDRFIGLDGKGSQTHFASYLQWERALANPGSDKPEKNKTSSPGKKVKTGPKRLSYKDQRELDAMEDTIMEAEEHLESCRKTAEDPDVASSATGSLEAFEALQAAQAEVDRLYQRWSELEALQQSL